MKIKRLWVSKYKNVEDIDLTFNSDLITLLVGKNGLGKSNLIEILALIFEQLNEVHAEQDIEKWASSNFEFEISYEVKLNDFNLSVKNRAKRNAKQENIKFYCESRPSKSESKYPFVEIEFSDFYRTKNDNLPKHIIGYYSGENKRIANIIRKSELVVEQNQKANKFTEDFRYLFFTQNHHCELLLLTLLIWNKEPYDTKFSKLIGQYLNVDEISGLEIIFNSPDWDYRDSAPKEYKNTGVHFLFENYNAGMDFPFWGCKGKANQLLQFLFDSSESLPAIYDNSEEPKLRGRPPKYSEEIIFNNLKISNLTKNANRFFQHPIQLFDALESCLHLNILKEIKFQIRKKDFQDLINFSQLSEGEQQLFTVMCLILIIGEDDCLFLLDEPDTHLNPDWQREYVQLLTDFNLNDTNSHIFVATHSPLIVQAGEDCDLILFYKNQKGEIKVDKNDLKIHNWRIDQVLTSKYFNLKSARPSYLDEYMEERNKLISKSEMTPEDEDQLNVLENKYGILPTGESIDDLKLFQFINKLEKKLNKK